MKRFESILKPNTMLNKITFSKRRKQKSQTSSKEIMVMTVMILAITGVTVACPHKNPGLQLWSDANTWNGNIPGFNSSVNVKGTVLLDIATPRLFSVTIERGSQLVFSPDVPLAGLTANNILVNGRLDIGAENCPFTGTAEILLTGKINDYTSDPAMGSKFLGVPNGGRLEIHGERRLSWTKLNRTVQKSSDSNRLNVVFEYTEEKNGTLTQGLCAFSFDPVTGHLLASRSGLNTDYELALFLAGVPLTSVVMFAIRGDLEVSDMYKDGLMDVFEVFTYGRVTQLSKLRTVMPRQAWAAIAVRGNGVEAFNSRAISMQFLEKKIGELTYQVTSRVLFSNANSASLPTIQMRVVSSPSTPIDETILHLLDDASSWRTGDQLVISSTDYDWQQAEVVTVMPCSECNSFQVKVKGFINYTHWGEVTQNIDMRAEVALLTRNIKIHGEMEKECYEPQRCDNFSFDTYGGHIKILKDFENVHIEGAEIYDMGQQSFIGNYPIHFHLCEQVDDRPNPPYVRFNSIHNTYARCVTVHATHGLLVQNNVAYDHLGHCYFLEDGGEKRTVFDGNLAIGTRKAYLIPSDNLPASFWITNPLTVLRNNVAAGSEHSGIWYLFPEEPVVLSYGKGLMKLDEARHTKILEFYNNVAHSNMNIGLFFEGKLGRDHGIDSFNNGYNARKNPLDPSSEADTIEFIRYTGYKNRMQNAWIRGNNVIVSHSSFSDSLKGITFALGGSGVQQLTHSIIVGESDNIGEASRFLFLNGTIFEWPRSLPLPGLCCYNLPVLGFVFNEGPVHVRHSWFDGFVANSIRPAGALGFLSANRFFSSPVSSVSNIHFGFSDPAKGNRVFDSTKGLTDGERSNTFRDLDGSVTGTANSTIVRPTPFLLTLRCVIRPTWRMAICPHHYIKLRFQWIGESSPYKMFMTRDDLPEYTESHMGETFTGFQLTPERTYIAHFNGTIPSKVVLIAVGLEAGSPQRLGICLPPDAIFTVKNNVLRSDFMQPSNNLMEVDRDGTGRKYYWDKNRGVLFVKLVNPYPRTESDLKNCPGRWEKDSIECPSLEIHIISGDLNDGNCTERAYPFYKTDPLDPVLRVENPYFQETTSAMYGAGATRPNSHTENTVKITYNEKN